MPLFRTILFAADFSERSKEAFQVACSLAHEQKTRLLVLHVIEKRPDSEPPLAYGELGVPISLGAGILPDHEALKQGLCEFYAPRHPIDVAYYVRDGLPAEALLCMAHEIGCDLIVTATHGRTGLRRLLAGSVAEAVLRKARCPVLALHTLEPAGEAPGIRVVLHPNDFSENSEPALNVARLLARDHGARLVVLHVAPPEVLINGSTMVPTDPRVYRDALEEIRGRLEGPDLKFPVETRAVQGDSAAEILRAAKEAECGLIVMGSHGRTGLGRLLMGSVAEAVLRKATCPVLIVKKPDSKTPSVSSTRGAEAVTVF